VGGGWGVEWGVAVCAGEVGLEDKRKSRGVWEIRAELLDFDYGSDGLDIFFGASTIPSRMCPIARPLTSHIPSNLLAASH
jgi:hypothetical protein